MKKYIFPLLVFWTILFRAYPSGLTDFLKLHPAVERIDTITAHPFFKEALQIFIRQPLDHRAPEKGHFLQRVFISSLDRNEPVVLITEGYSAAYGRNNNYLCELCTLLYANQVMAEHRCFGESKPESPEWSCLTVENAAGDHHKIVDLLKPWFTGEWVNTGISKGGQTALLHRVFFPDDVDMTVSYVAPMNFGVEDGRHEPYIAKIPGTKEVRGRIKAFQKEILRRRNSLMPLFRNYIREQKLTFRTSVEEIFDLTLLEYSFSFWQWGRNPDEIPALAAENEELFNHWMTVSSPGYYSIEEWEKTGPFFIQAACELGYYGYDTRPFRKLLAISSARGYLKRVFLPGDCNFSFDPTSIRMTQRFLNTTDLPLIFIYGREDPWTASGVIIPRKSNMLKIVQNGGSHTTRIATLDETNKRAVMEKISQTVGIKVPAAVQ